MCVSRRSHFRDLQEILKLVYGRGHALGNVCLYQKTIVSRILFRRMKPKKMQKVILLQIDSYCWRFLAHFCCWCFFRCRCFLLVSFVCWCFLCQCFLVTGVFASDFFAAGVCFLPAVFLCWCFLVLSYVAAVFCCWCCLVVVLLAKQVCETFNSAQIEIADANSKLFCEMSYKKHVGSAADSTCGFITSIVRTARR